MLSKSFLALLAVSQSVSAFPAVALQPGVDASLLKRQQDPPPPTSEENCPFNPDHRGAAPYDPKYPYNYAHDGIPGKGKGGYKVPADGDTAHYFVAPDYTKDIRGPCPGINVMANHNFLSHDGITTFTELVDAQQQVYNVGYDLAVLLAVLGLTTTDGDIVTGRLSIGCEATKRTSFAPALTGSQPGLSGHNKFEADTSLTRMDYFLTGGDNFSMNSTMFGMMTDSTGGLYNRENLAKYRYERYQQSRAQNQNFYFGPFSLLLFGASSFLYELFPSGTHNYVPDIPTISSIFGAEKDSSGNWKFNGKEQLPENWTNRPDPYDIPKVGREIFAQYALHPVQFGGATADGSFNVLSGQNGLLESGSLSKAVNAENMACFLYMLATERTPSSLNGFITPTVKSLAFALNQLKPGFDNLGCPFPLT